MGDLIEFPSLEQRLSEEDIAMKELALDSKYEFISDIGYCVIGVTATGFFLKGMLDVMDVESPVSETTRYMLMAVPLPLNAVIGRYAGKLFASCENVREKTISEKEGKNLGTLIGVLLTGVVAVAGYIGGATMTYTVKSFM